MREKVKNVNVKDVAKNEILAIVSKALNDAGFEVKDGVRFGFTNSTVVVSTDVCDVQVKLISTKVGVTRYEEVE